MPQTIITTHVISKVWGWRLRTGDNLHSSVDWSGARRWVCYIFKFKQKKPVKSVFSWNACFPCQLWGQNHLINMLRPGVLLVVCWTVGGTAHFKDRHRQLTIQSIAVSFKLKHSPYLRFQGSMGQFLWQNLLKIRQWQEWMISMCILICKHHYRLLFNSKIHIVDHR